MDRPSLPVVADGRVDLKSLDRATLVAWLVDELGFSEVRALRVYKGLWRHAVRRVEDIPDVPARELARLAARGAVTWLEVDRRIDSADGTTKFLWALGDGRTVESVLIPDDDKLTLCVSSQVGCAMACTFCLTGDLGLVRQLTAAEIASQPLQVQAAIGPGRRITNLVFMGMGEPLHNLANLLPALRTCLDDHGLGLSHRRITVSTVGLVPKLQELAAALPVNVAISLNATTDAQRRAIMPITAKYGLDELLDACRALPLPSGKRIQFEYVMLAGFNDSADDAERLAALLRGIPAKVNLIPYNENPDRDLRRPTPEVVTAFQDVLAARGVSTTVRHTRGLDVSAACGQLGKARQQLATGAIAPAGVA